MNIEISKFGIVLLAVYGLIVVFYLAAYFDKNVPKHTKIAGFLFVILLGFLTMAGVSGWGARRFTEMTGIRVPSFLGGPRQPAKPLETTRVTFPEGCTVRDVLSLLAQNGVADEDSLWDAAENGAFEYGFLDQDSADITRLEGCLFPDTYEFYKPEDPSRALNRLLSNFQKKLTDRAEAFEAAENRGYSVRDIITIASLIEKETDGSDQANIASVIYNRLEGPGDRHGTNGLLQINAALLYAIPDHSGPVTYADLEIDSPYNLYKNPGLPPSPIANPGAACIDAALFPEETDYYYYALGKDGKHRFFSQYSDFNRFLASADYVGN